MIVIEPEQPGDAAAIDHLIDLCFGPGRHAKAASRLREGLTPVSALSHVVRVDGALRGSLRFWPVLMGEAPALLLGPLAVDPALRGRGAGIGLMMVALARAGALGHRAVMLVGDEPYYARVGFRRAAPGLFHLEWPIDPRRLLIRELLPGALEGASGAVRPDPRGLAALAIPGEREEAARKQKGKRSRQQGKL